MGSKTDVSSLEGKFKIVSNRIETIQNEKLDIGCSSVRQVSAVVHCPVSGRSSPENHNNMREKILKSRENKYFKSFKCFKNFHSFGYL